MNRLLTAFALLALAGGALAQDEGSPEAAPPPPPEATPGAAPAVEVAWPDDEARKVADMLSGVWVSTSAIDDSGDTLIMSVAPVVFNGLDGTLYAEMARSGDLARPYRQILLQLYRFESTLRLRTYEFTGDVASSIAGMTHIPERFPTTIPFGELKPTMDMDLELDGDGYNAQTPFPYPTTASGAIQMTSSMRISPSEIRTEDTGFGTDGQVLWGGPDGAVSFERADGLVEVTRLERDDWSHQYIQISYSEGEGDPVRDGDFLALHYSGYLENGMKFDSSYDRGEPFRYRVPGRLIEGWLMGTEDIRQGATRRLIIPPELGYGSRANARIPANSTLIFDVEAIFIERAEEPGENPAEAQAIEDTAAEGE